LFQVHRLCLANEEPRASETSLLQFFGWENLMQEDLVRTSLYQLLEKKYGQPPLEDGQELEASQAECCVRQVLEL
jgi:DNA-binding GntR family transcriptional regulator